MRRAEIGVGWKKQFENQAGQQCAGNLCADITPDLLCWETLRSPKTNGEGRIQMCAAHIPERVNHGEHAEAEG